MLQTLLAKVVGTQNERELKRLRPIVGQVNAFEASIQPLSDEALRAKTAEFRQRFAQGETLDDLLPEAFAVVREAGRRTLNMRHFDVQLIGGAVLHKGKIAEMKTGEGKTLVATLPSYLNALEGKGVHVVTVNDYLARRDSEWMGRLYKSLGLKVGVIVHDLDDEERKEAYNADITYATNNTSPRRSPKRACCVWRSCLTSAISTTPRTSSGTTTCSRPSAPTCSTSGIANTSSATAKKAPKW